LKLALSDNAVLFAGAANARLAVFAGAPSVDFLFRHLSESIPRVRDLGEIYNRMKASKTADAWPAGYSNATPSFFPSVQTTLQ